MTIKLRFRHLGKTILAGITYFALVFALGFLLGTARTLLVRDGPDIWRLVGVLIELPIILSASWFLCRYVGRRFAVEPTVVAGAVMGGIAFALLILAELLLGAVLFGQSPSEHFALYKEASYGLGLAAQLGFAVIPPVQMLRPQRR